MWLIVKRRIFRVVINLIVRSLMRVEISGMDKLENAKGPTIGVSNHLGRFDAALSLGLVRRDDLIIVVAEKYRQSAFYRWMVKTLDLLFLERNEADFGTLKEVLRRLKSGGMLMIAPEGTRSHTEALLEGKPGAAFLAARSGATIIPSAVIGSEDRVVKEQLRKFRRPRVRIIVGEPFTLPPIPKTDRDAYFEECTDEIMAQIAALLPEKYRGVYATHPRVAELITLKS
ncbi:MAG: 1-acyl-sn-glycerol-3-phosphate acyltransferase [Anaerolineales bacterium]|nr:1-acyl-sn-glycerol-3-phosphate acyltransferase [Anaerolineales bacterium]